MRRTDGSLHDVSSALGVTFAVVGSYQRYADRVRITARVLNIASGEALADAKVDGALADIFQLQDQVVAQFSKELGIAALHPPGGPRETPSLEAYRAYTEAWLHLETLDLREIPRAIADFEKAIDIDPRYALALTGLASAELAAYEVTRSDNAPAKDLLKRAIDHARGAIALDDTLAEPTPRWRCCLSAPGRRWRPSRPHAGPSRLSRPIGGIFSTRSRVLGRRTSSRGE